MTVISEHPWGLGAGCKGTRRRARPPWGSEHTPKEVLLQSWTLAGAPHGDAERLSEKLLSASECGGLYLRSAFLSFLSLTPPKRPVKETGDRHPVAHSTPSGPTLCNPSAGLTLSPLLHLC